MRHHGDHHSHFQTLHYSISMPVGWLFETGAFKQTERIRHQHQVEPAAVTLRVPPRLTREVFRACPARRRPWGRPRALVERLCHTAGLGMPWNPPGRTGGSVHGDGSIILGVIFTDYCMYSSGISGIKISLHFRNMADELNKRSPQKKIVELWISWRWERGNQLPQST